MDKYQFLKEEERLDYTLQTLNEEVLNYIEKRKEIANYILDYRKNFIEEHKDDEDALMEYFDHERYVKEESYKQIDKKLMELTKLKETPYFGKVIFSDEDECQEEIYVSTQTACSSNNPVSKAVLAVTKNKNYASSSIRISLSYLTTKEEIDMFVKVLNNKIKELS